MHAVRYLPEEALEEAGSKVLCAPVPNRISLGTLLLSDLLSTGILLALPPLPPLLPTALMLLLLLASSLRTSKVLKLLRLPLRSRSPIRARDREGLKERGWEFEFPANLSTNHNTEHLG